MEAKGSRGSKKPNGARGPREQEEATDGEDQRLQGTVRSGQRHQWTKGRGMSRARGFKGAQKAKGCQESKPGDGSKEPKDARSSKEPKGARGSKGPEGGSAGKDFNEPKWAPEGCIRG